MPDTVFRLMERHQKLDEHLRRAQSRKFPDPLEIVRLKKLKLAIKDRLSRLMKRRTVTPSIH
ncbi:MAG: YdcH family protein [Novosphingobium sp.]|nr:YdcH family protein [Novosphingobium sp.]